MSETQLPMVILVNHLIHEPEIEVTPRSYLFSRLCQAVKHVHLVYSRSYSDVQDAVGIPVYMIFSVNKEGHRLYGIVVTETAETDVFTESHDRIIFGDSWFINSHPRIFLSGRFVENIHISVARLEVTTFGNLDTHHRQVAVIYRKTDHIDGTVSTSSSPRHVVVGRVQYELGNGDSFYTRNSRQFTDNRFSAIEEFVRDFTYQNHTLIVTIITVLYVMTLQVHDAYGDNQHERNKELETNQKRTQHFALRGKTERAFQCQCRLERGDVIRGISSGQQTHTYGDSS